MIEHYIEIGPDRTSMIVDSLVLRIKGIGELARRRDLSDDERAEISELTGDWEMAQIALLSFSEAEAILIHCRLQGLRT